MTTPSLNTRQTIVQLLSNMQDGKEIRAYLQRFSSIDQSRFAVIKIGGAILAEQLRETADALAFLHTVGLTPIVIHGGGPQLDRAATVRWAVTQTGVHERGTSNCAPAIDRWTRRMGLPARPCRPWCGAFVHQAFLRGGVRLSARIIDPDRSYGDAVAGRRHLRAIAVGSVRPGDLLFFAFRPGLRASHLAIVRSRPRAGRVATVEGNVGHAVRLKRRGLRYTVLAARVTP